MYLSQQVELIPQVEKPLEALRHLHRVLVELFRDVGTRRTCVLCSYRETKRTRHVKRSLQIC